MQPHVGQAFCLLMSAQLQQLPSAAAGAVAGDQVFSRT
jgi:hypothetical protein